MSPQLSGKDGSGVPLKEHGHAYFLPLDRDGDGRLDHVLVRCQAGLERLDQLALDCVRTLWQSKGRPDVKVVMVALGSSSTLLQRSATWTSSTPFVPTRHHKPKQSDFGPWLENEFRRALAQHGLPAPLRVEPIASLELSRTKRRSRWGAFVRSRKEDSSRPGFGFRITFAEDVPGPFAIGYGSHFGLGQFVPGT